MAREPQAVGPDPRTVQDHLNKILRSRSLADSPRSRKFLEFVVKKKIEGQDDCLKETVIAVEVFQKGSDFDSRLDSTVRRGANRLRAKLKGYCDTEGQGDSLKIELPEGRYVPRFIETPPLSASPERRTLTVRKPSPFRKSVGWIGGALVLLVGFAWWFARPLAQPKILSFAQLTNLGDVGGRFLSDGAFIYLVRRQSLLSLSVGGGQPAVISTPIRISGLEDIHVGRSELLALGRGAGRTDQKLWAIELPSGSARPVTEFDVNGACWSPDGTRVAYARGVDLFVAGRDGSKPEKLAALPGIVSEVRWSPDMKSLRLGVSRSRAGTREIWEVDADGTRLHPLFAGWDEPAREGSGAWASDGAWFVFDSERSGHRDIWAIKEKKSLFQRASREPVQLTHGPMVFAEPLLSRDGRRLFVFGSQGRAELVRYDSKRGEFVTYLGGMSALWVSFSRDKRWVAYQSFPEGVLWRMRPDGSQRLQLTFPPGETDGGAWSPDGKRIACRIKRPGGAFKIYIVSAEGGDPQELLPGDPAEEGIPSWSSDGKAVVFGEVAALFGHPTGDETIHVCDVQTRQVTLLPGSSGLWTPRWSPDGRYISALTADRQRLKLFNTETRRWRDLGMERVGNPTWASDSRHIYFDMLQSGEVNAIVRVRVSDGRKETVASLDNLSREIGWWSGLDADDSPVVARSLSIGEIYALDLEWP